MININSVRDTVLAILNKENRGYITPSEFNKFAKQAQLDIFESYFFDRAHFMVNRKGDDGELMKLYQEKIDIFTVSDGTNLTYENSRFTLPSNLYRLMDVYTTLSSSQTFTSIGGQTEFRINNVPGGQNIPIFNVSVTDDGVAVTPTISNRTITFATPPALNSSIVISYDYGRAIIDKVEHVNSRYVFNSPLTSPSSEFPKYERYGNTLSVLPTTITSGVTIHYIRRPNDPIWNSIAFGSREPVYNAASSTNFEIHPSDEYLLVDKILTMAGVSIREIGVSQLGSQEQLLDEQQKKS